MICSNFSNDRCLKFIGVDAKITAHWIGEIKMKLKNKTALVTGASRGLGKVIAAELALMGADVYLN